MTHHSVLSEKADEKEDNTDHLLFKLSFAVDKSPDSSSSTFDSTSYCFSTSNG